MGMEIMPAIPILQKCKDIFISKATLAESFWKLSILEKQMFFKTLIEFWPIVHHQKCNKLEKKIPKKCAKMKTQL